MTSKIEWTDETWPIVTGCTPVSPGCKHCYAARMAATRLKHHPRYRGLAAMVMPGVFGWTGEIRLNHHDVLEQPLRWKKPRRIFVASMGDLFHEDVPFEFVANVFDRMYQTPHHIYQVLTKRPGRMLEFVKWHSPSGEFKCICANVHLGVSVENQEQMWRTEYLRGTPAAVRFLSLEPLLGPIDLRGELLGGDIHWVIVGGESGPNARLMRPNWARSIRDQCQTAGTPFFFKQWGAWFPRSQWEDNPDLILPDDDCCVEGRNLKIVNGDIMHRVGKKRAGCLMDSVLHKEYPR